jgi:predicted DNA-binding transcriptional regulator YafY/transcriptional regulator with XRE-family HTH domain
VTASRRRPGADADLADQDKDAAAQRRELVAQLARRRRADGLSQADVASRMQTSQSAVARLESGRHDTQLSTLARYAETLGLSLDEALQLIESPQPADYGSDDSGQAPEGPDPDYVLTSRQREVLQAIRESTGKRGYPPSLREIGEAVGLTSPSTVAHHLRTLQEAGYLQRDSGRPRAVEVREPDPPGVLLVRPGTCLDLRWNALSVLADGRADGQGWDVVTTRVPDTGDLAEYIASFGQDVVVLDPPELRAAVIARLEVTERPDRPAMSRLAARPGAGVSGTAPLSAQAARHADIREGGRVEEAAARVGAALAAGRRVHLRHYNWKKDEVTERDVDPLRLFVEPRLSALYLEGWCRLRQEMRFFRLDRVLELEVLDVPAAPPAGAERVNPEHGLFQPSADDLRVEIELSAAGGWVAEYYPCESVFVLRDGRIRVVLRTPDTSWVRRLALRLGENGRVVSPPALVAEIRSASAAALKNYQSGSPGAELVSGYRGRRAGSAAAAGQAG